jgi:hypothetical protein
MVNDRTATPSGERIDKDLRNAADRLRRLQRRRGLTQTRAQAENVLERVDALLEDIAAIKTDIRALSSARTTRET